MEDQNLQLEPAPELEVIDGSLRDSYDEEFYEKIEAPKFVDFTKPYTIRTDDRYWFCSRVGCDQKHEEEINHEEISKNFVLRVMAARSPNVKLQKALNKQHLSMKCPQTAPAKPSKSRIPRLAMVSSLAPHKNGDSDNKIKPCSKVSSTPLANKSRQVAAKYMTTPRNKMGRPNPDSFRSVQNPKKPAVDVKNRTVAKALVFHSPKKVICVKKSVELHTPLKKICQGMKKLELASQKKTLMGTKNKLKKPETEDTSSRQLTVCKSVKKSKTLAHSKSTTTQEKKILTSETSNSHDLKGETKDLTIIEDKENAQVDDDDDGKEDALKSEDNENTESAEDYSKDEVAGQMDDDGKENALIPQNNNRSDYTILSKEMHKKKRVVKTNPVGMKCIKPKATNIKPFRLRTDERGILREAILEKKLNVNATEKEVLKDTSMIKRTYRVPRSSKLTSEQRKHNDASSDKCEKEMSAVGSKPATNRAHKCPESTHQRPRFMSSIRTKSPIGVVSTKKVIKEKSCKLTSDVTVSENKTRSVSAARSTSRGKRALTVAKEPNFHTSHLPRTCSKIIA